MNKNQRISIFFAVAVMTMASSCKKPVEVVPFDKESLLINLSDNLISPSLSTLETTMTQLQSDFVDFQSAPNQANLDVFRESWKQAYLAWQMVKPFDVGPIRNYGFKGSTGTYPTDTTKIEANIASGSYNLASAGNVDAIGLTALDFLLYRVNALTYFTGDANYMTYASDVIAKLVSETTTVKNEWATYAPTFKASTGTETTSAFSELVNEFNRDYELIKTAKVAIPSGAQSLGIPLPEYIEARNSGFSFELIRQNVRAINNIYQGNANLTGADGVGFDDYLVQLERGSLDQTINANFNQIISKIDSFNGTFEEEINTNAQGVNELYNLLQGQVVNLKTDMTSAFGVLITYQDNDGD
jgi:predicted lipoprotein